MKILFFIPIFVNAIQNVTGDSNEFYVQAVRYRVLKTSFTNFPSRNRYFPVIFLMQVNVISNPYRFLKMQKNGHVINPSISKKFPEVQCAV